MKLNKEELKRLSSLSDKRLEEEIRRMAEAKGPAVKLEWIGSRPNALLSSDGRQRKKPR